MRTRGRPNGQRGLLPVITIWLACVLAVVAVTEVIDTVDATPIRAQPLAVARLRQVDRSAVVAVGQLPSTFAAVGPKHRLQPFRPPDPDRFAKAKQSADAGVLPVQRGDVQTATIGSTTQAKPLATGPTIQEVANFPVMSFQQQAALLGVGQEVAPPDTQLAAGPTSLLEMVNDSGSVWTKAGGLAVSFDLNNFYRVPLGYLISDPRVLYDASAERWFASAMAVDSLGDGQAYLGVSMTADPTGSWDIYTISANASRTVYDRWS